MSPALLRLLWKAIDESSSAALVGLTEQDLTQQLLHQLRKSKTHLTPEEIEAVRHYVHVRSPLIEDVVRSPHSLFRRQSQPAHLRSSSMMAR